MVSGPSSSAVTHSAPIQTAAPDYASSGPASTVTIVALTDNVRIKVSRKSDSVVLFPRPGSTDDSLKRGDRQDFPNVPLYLTASALQDVQIEYKGKDYPTGFTGYARVGLDFSNLK